MIVVADTGPVNYLVLIGEIEILGELYGNVLIPVAVCDELSRPKAPAVVRAWIASPPAWLKVRAPGTEFAPELAHLDPGEREAILLAEEFGADQIIIDEMRGRREAARRHLQFTETLGVLAAAAAAGLIDFRAAIERLRETSFYVSDDVLKRLNSVRQ